jgi:hypothetical protein
MKKLFFSLVILFAGFVNTYAQTGGPEIKFDSIEHNYGDIKENGGKASHVFWFTNTGTDTLKLTRVQPGCGCTASDYTKDGILPGKKGFVSAQYDPLGRPGPFKKSIAVSSNAKTTPNLTLFISGNVIPKPKDFTDTFRVHLGSLLVDRNNPVFHNMNFNEVRNDTIKFYNEGTTEIQVSVKEAPAHIKVVLTDQKIKPSGRGYMFLTYDATKLTSQGNRNDRIILQTSDEKQPEKMFYVTANILEAPAPPTLEQKYPFQMGNIRMTKNSVVFPQIKNTESKTDTVIIYNSGTYAIQIDFQKMPEYLKAVSSTNVLMPEKTAEVKITYDATKVNGYGFLSDGRVTLQTTDSVQPVKVIYVSANVKEDFSKLTQKQRENAPRIEFDNVVYDFGNKPTGQPVKYSFTLSNKGKSDLIIRKVSASCGCTATNPEKTLLKPGETSKIDITFNTEGRVGDQQKSITVISNDPEKPEVILMVKGKLEKAE